MSQDNSHLPLALASALMWASGRPEERLFRPKSWAETREDYYMFLTFSTDGDLMRYDYLRHSFDEISLNVTWLSETFDCYSKDEIADELQELRDENPSAFFRMMFDIADDERD